jgi:hypothetical protein
MQKNIGTHTAIISLAVFLSWNGLLIKQFPRVVTKMKKPSGGKT